MRMRVEDLFREQADHCYWQVGVSGWVALWVVVLHFVQRILAPVCVFVSSRSRSNFEILVCCWLDQDGYCCPAMEYDVYVINVHLFAVASMDPFFNQPNFRDRPTVVS
jgi:hypothetical protein